MLTIQGALAAFIVFAILMVVTALLHPELARRRGGRLLVVAAFLAAPALALWAGTAVQVQSSKTTSFCLSCHVMEDYGRSLEIDDGLHLAANHFQYFRVDQRHACYECHTSYTMYGDVEAKWRGVRHLWINAVGTVSDPIELYEPYQNRDCLRCHREARSFLEGGFHEDMMADLESNEVSCLECHGPVHGVDEVDDLPRWSHPLVSGALGDDSTASAGDAP